MKKCSKNGKRGFTLVEMVLVIAIIVILAAVMLIGVSGYISKARTAASALTEHYDSTTILVGIISEDAGLT